MQAYVEQRHRVDDLHLVTTTSTPGLFAQEKAVYGAVGILGRVEDYLGVGPGREARRRAVRHDDDALMITDDNNNTCCSGRGAKTGTSVLLADGADVMRVKGESTVEVVFFWTGRSAFWG